MRDIYLTLSYFTCLAWPLRNKCANYTYLLSPIVETLVVWHSIPVCRFIKHIIIVVLESMYLRSLILSRPHDVYIVNLDLFWNNLTNFPGINDDSFNSNLWWQSFKNFEINGLVTNERTLFYYLFHHGSENCFWTPSFLSK